MEWETPFCVDPVRVSVLIEEEPGAAIRLHRDFCAWAYTPRKNSAGVLKNEGNACAYCMRVWESRYKSRYGIKALAVFLGRPQEEHDKFLAYVGLVIAFFIEKQSTKVRINWNELDKSVLTVIQIQAVSVEEPDDEVWEYSYYCRMKGDPATNGLGHRIISMQGKKSVLVPSPPIHKIKTQKGVVNRQVNSRG